MKHTVTILPKDIHITAAHGTNLLALLQSSGLAPNAPCGGNGTCKKCQVTINGVSCLSCQYTVESDIVVTLPQTENMEILRLGESIDISVDPEKPGYLIAFDIGTTTVVCFLLSPDGIDLAAESMLNPQFAYGADVIARIQNALHGKMGALTDTIQTGMVSLIEKCCANAGISPEEISVVSVVGNPCMQQLFMGISPKNLAAVPFDPVLTHRQILAAVDYLPNCPNAQLLVVPDISGYLGADTIGCLLATKMYQTDDTVLMVDIGTNGEMVLAHNNRMVACSTAAGPALEGANIKFGMRGASGAIDHVWAENGEIVCSVIGNSTPDGICGSGLIDAVAVLLENKALNKRGRIQSTEEIDGDRILRLTPQIYLTQDDIRQVQLAKGAICAGIQLMAEHLGISLKEINRVLLAGAFGSFLRPESACRIGLLPEELNGRITAAGNIAGSGAKILAKNKSQLLLAQQLRDRVEFLELAEIPTFQRTFAKNMSFRE